MAKISKQVTKIAIASCKLEWRIDQLEKLMKLYKNGHSIVSEQFSCTHIPSFIWELHIYPNGKREEDSGSVSFFLRQIGLGHPSDDATMTEFQIYALDSRRLRVSICHDTKDFSNQQGRGKFQVRRDKLMTALHADGSLLVVCEVEFLPPGTKLTAKQGNVCEDDCTKFSLQRVNKEILETGLFSDCKLQVGDATFMPHKCILGQSSQVFYSAFSQTVMREAQDEIIVINDSRPETISAMLEFIYTGTISHVIMKNFAQEIFIAADKYDVAALKKYCEIYLASLLSIRNICEMAMIADTYYGSHLKNACASFIAANYKLVVRCLEWKELKQTRSKLANDLLEAALVDHF